MSITSSLTPFTPSATGARVPFDVSALRRIGLPDPETPAPHAPASHSHAPYPLPAEDLLGFGVNELPFVLPRARRLLRLGLINWSDLTVADPQPDPDVTVVIPARNEAATVAAIVHDSLAYAAHVLVIDGSSTDGTAKVARAAGARVLTDSGQGKGQAMRFALTQVETEICVFVDADGSHDPIDIPLLVAPIKAGLADHVGGSRMLGGSDELHGGGDEFLRLAGSAFITYLVNRRFGARLSDSQNGFRAVRTAAIRALNLRSRHTTIEMEMLMASLAAGLRVAEVPTHERPRAAGYSKISLGRPTTWLAYGFCLLRGLCQRRTRAPRAFVAG